DAGERVRGAERGADRAGAGEHARDAVEVRDHDRAVLAEADGRGVGERARRADVLRRAERAARRGGDERRVTRAGGHERRRVAAASRGWLVRAARRSTTGPAAIAVAGANAGVPAARRAWESDVGRLRDVPVAARASALPAGSSAANGRGPMVTASSAFCTGAN